ncbi:MULTISPECIES: DUF4062 domain-containing protein [Stenotrophomonas]|uniref:DUF4062 domain-containing protein n=1 Tax=Stenotrophomonas maltophilia TaxID=40324 RepID=A0A2J0UE38_STEMA|nr:MULTISPECIES: DUF4062 domain-containing protein [Stenotrophomonas]PJL31718.1 hypothetical protein B9Y64_09105 [Stenotrophomonas maltophilia]
MTLRAFISSTMDDLVNERRLVAKRLKELGIEPVNAEAMPPSGLNSWDRIRGEIDSCQIVILILGDRYGWVPDDGHGAKLGKSVTHLEYDHAKERGKIILPFQKRLRYGHPVDTLRDDFRREVSEWSDGTFRQEFDFADELSELAGAAIIDLLRNTFLKNPPYPHRRPRSIPQPALPTSNRSTNKDVLIAGAGMSIAAGMPPASLLIGLLSHEIWDQPSQSERFNFSDVAEFYALQFGKEQLISRLVEAMDRLGNPQPTTAHKHAVNYFGAIITTNFDNLFEQACEQQGIPYIVMLPGESLPEVGNRLPIYKLIGSLDTPESLRLTQRETAVEVNSDLVMMAKQLTQRNPVTVIGHGLRDGLIPEILSQRPESLEGRMVSPIAAPMEEILLNRFHLKKVEISADDFMEDLIGGQ